MEIQPAINFLIGSILFSMGLIVISLMILFLNNVFGKYWRPIKWQIYQPQDYAVIDHSVIEELKQTIAKQKSSKKETNV